MNLWVNTAADCPGSNPAVHDKHMFTKQVKSSRKAATSVSEIGASVMWYTLPLVPRATVRQVKLTT